MEPRQARYEVQYGPRPAEERDWAEGFASYDGAKLTMVKGGTPPDGPLHTERIGDALDYAYYWAEAVRRVRRQLAGET